MTLNPVLEIENLTVNVANTRNDVVKNASFQIKAGETVCIVGESGSGKSVSSLAVMGLLPKGALRAKGKILLDGENILQARPERLRQLRASSMSMVFQEPMTALNPVERVGDQIEEVLRIHGVSGRQTRKNRVLEMMRAVHLPDPKTLYNAYPHQLSGGQRQRVVICMALILRPRLLIADEPTTALDVTTQKQILSLMKELQENLETAVLFITHDFGVVSEIADRIVVMNRGEVVETGTRKEILSNPQNSYTRMLLSSVPGLVPSDRTRTFGAPTLRVTDLQKTYSDTRLFGAKRTINAVKNASLSLRQGEVVGVVGESGSGKSTLARCIVRLIDPTSGRIQLGNDDIADLSQRAMRPIRSRIQIVFQDPYRSLNGRLPVGESICEGLRNFGWSRSDANARAVELLELVGLDPESMKRYPHQFSGGQRQRIAIARALALEPDVIIADEAVSALDVSVQKQVLDLLESIRVAKHIGMLFVTHDLRVAAQICDTILVMQHGNVVEAGETYKVLQDPQEEYTRMLLASAPGRDWDFRNFRPLSRDAHNLDKSGGNTSARFGARN
ncbi:ABC transporter ATP-binding protein [Nitratireductor sp. GZWM139]|uniref:ABC transporter ATP-binding protein n=1 Tax=Nitratireductor sp. GZWM139 TaxID=2950541 RepID=UPI0024BF0644|nr:ABC transporter ATP-binding protein [Nitratireductor sp. GZWM139]MDJ1466098.1 ABC transporter ATP-binding protein [Nitratireductor sp. GZWM139]